MKTISDKVYISAAIIVVAASIFYLGSNLNDPQSHVITTTGEAKTTVAPDMARVSVGVQATSASASDAQNQARTIANKIMSAVSGFGIDQSGIQTTQLTVQPNTRYNPQTGEVTTNGFTATDTITVTTTKLDAIGPMVDAVVAAGANNVGGIEFFLSDVRQSALKASLLGDAAADAKQKAQNIASSVGSRISGTRSVSESSFVLPLFASASVGKSDSMSTPVSPGEVDVTASVTASFEIA